MAGGRQLNGRHFRVPNRIPLQRVASRRLCNTCKHLCRVRVPAQLLKPGSNCITRNFTYRFTRTRPPTTVRVSPPPRRYPSADDSFAVADIVAGRRAHTENVIKTAINMRAHRARTDVVRMRSVFCDGNNNNNNNTHVQSRRSRRRRLDFIMQLFSNYSGALACPLKYIAFAYRIGSARDSGRPLRRIHVWFCLHSGIIVRSALYNACVWLACRWHSIMRMETLRFDPRHCVYV